MDGYLQLMEDRKIIATLEKSNNVTIPKYTGVTTLKYIKNVGE